MEKQLTDLTIFEGYKNRQVILNYYQDDDYLWKRDGFHFASIQLANEKLLFLKKDGSTSQIALQEYKTMASNSDFQNYYVFHYDVHTRLEIYFP
ncbi:hypothetical protein J1P26_15575 [Neobacillus sp. MM2021_6]|uniref:hypothetical protein n=1 Tax=Bacillaceae TaxID=186817 RepID=UPI0014079F85|nr:MULTISPECIES: hypothetical protein [Bacillaceae]MBO0961121.1 hypothetical protein [Neobacillus sp. MM2021_6]NHC21120.1 hypothetical protein [Bacillus sp. MM2020_4]